MSQKIMAVTWSILLPPLETIQWKCPTTMEAADWKANVKRLDVLSVQEIEGDQSDFSPNVLSSQKLVFCVMFSFSFLRLVLNKKSRLRPAIITLVGQLFHLLKRRRRFTCYNMHVVCITSFEGGCPMQHRLSAGWIVTSCVFRATSCRPSPCLQTKHTLS